MSPGAGPKRILVDDVRVRRARSRRVDLGGAGLEEGGLDVREETHLGPPSQRVEAVGASEIDGAFPRSVDIARDRGPATSKLHTARRPGDLDAAIASALEQALEIGLVGVCQPRSGTHRSSSPSTKAR
ncbi:MAG: hypothetical protein ACYTG1_01105 [Planctomycetota bacterium]|jgi:hypothetical protein